MTYVTYIIDGIVLGTFIVVFFIMLVMGWAALLK